MVSFPSCHTCSITQLHALVFVPSSAEICALLRVPLREGTNGGVSVQSQHSCRGAAFILLPFGYSGTAASATISYHRVHCTRPRGRRLPIPCSGSRRTQCTRCRCVRNLSYTMDAFSRGFVHVGIPSRKLHGFPTRTGGDHQKAVAAHRPHPRLPLESWLASRCR